MDIFVGNLLFEATEGDLRKLFEGFGNVVSAVIVMSKEKKKPKSRGFGFVKMADEEQALAAISALHGKEYMGRVLNVEPARPKTEVPREIGLRKRAQPKFEARAKKYFPKERERGKTDKLMRLPGPGTYGGGRRSRSYMSRQGSEDMLKESKPRKRFQDNLGRWRKKNKSKPWEKPAVETKAWKKPARSAKPWSKSAGHAQKPRFKRSKNQQ